MLSNILFNPSYNSKKDNIISSFYIKAFKNSIRYDRVSAYFDSKILRMYSSGIEELYKNKGTVRFIFSCDITDEDYDLMKQGYELRDKYKQKLLSALCEEDINIDLSNLAHLIALGVVDIKIAFTKTGIFHDKYGLFRDEEDNVLYFRGSNNETLSAVLNNYEGFETTLSWKCDQNELSKIENAVESFDSLWNNEVEGVVTLDLPSCVKDKLLSFSSKAINFIYYSKENAIIFDVTDDGKYLFYNNLNDKSKLNSYSQLYLFKFAPYVANIEENKYYLKEMSYIKLNEFINSIRHLGCEFGFDVFVSPILRELLFQKDLLIEKRKNIGIAIKHRDMLIVSDFEKFRDVVNHELSRQLRDPQMWDAYHIATMIKSANFSVPGSGKTSIVYGAYAYLSYMNKVDKIVMIGPKNSFYSWKKEFEENFKDKKVLNCLDIQDDFDQSKHNLLKYFSYDKNLILINYESVPNLINVIKKIVDEKSLLVFDEVHRIKAIKGKRADACLRLASNANYKVVLTGTPIPNSYKDLYNMLNLLYPDEYESFFNFKVNELEVASKNPSLVEAINNKIYPFFCRTTKKQLNVPEPFDDDIVSGDIIADDDEKEIIGIIHRTFQTNPLLLFIRLIQASSNPSLVLEKINLLDFYLDDNELNEETLNKISDDEILMSEDDYEFIKNHSKTRKIDKCAEMIIEDVKSGEKVIAWGIFIKNLTLLEQKLIKLGAKPVVISGQMTPKERDVAIEEFEEGKYNVLITNPHTLAESISLHKICHRAYYFEYSFNLVHMLQSRDRIHRLGITEQERPKYTYMFLSTEDSLYETIDKRIYYRLKEKERIMIDSVEGNDIVFMEDNYMDDIMDILNAK